VTEYQRGNFMLKHIILLILITCSLPSFSSDVHSFKKATWNMQGSGGGAKWSNNLLNTILNQGRSASPDIIAIQEGGAGPGHYEGNTFRPITGVVQQPEPGTATSPIPVDAIGYTHGEPEIVEFIWNIRSGVAPYYIYGLISDILPNGHPGRVNSYIISRRRANEVISIAHRAQDNISGVRPHFGIRIDTSFFFSVHSISSHAAATDTAYRLDTIEQYVSSRGSQYDWAAMGDFNADPARVHIQMENYPSLSQVQTVSTGCTTQISGGELDYMFFRDVVGASGNSILSSYLLSAIISLYISDHFPVRFW
jgi:hypothetical protein